MEAQGEWQGGQSKVCAIGWQQELNERREDWGQDGEGLWEREVGEGRRVGNEVGGHAGQVVLVPKGREL